MKILPAVLLAGVQKPLTVEVNGSSTRTANHPNSMKGTSTTSALGLFSVYVQRTAAVTTTENYVKSLGFNP